MSGAARARTVSPPAALDVAVESTCYPNAVCVGDVDGDGDGELVVGTAAGELLVFKGDGARPWRCRSGLSTITAVTVGDVRNVGRPAIVCATAEGVCLVFEPSAGDDGGGRGSASGGNGGREQTAGPAVAGAGAGGAAGDVNTGTTRAGLQGDQAAPRQQQQQLVAVHRQRVPVNTKVLVVANLGGSGGKNILAVGRTDRKVLSFVWSADESRLLPQWEVDFPGQIGSLSPVRSASGPLLGVSQPGGALLMVNARGETQASGLSPPDTQRNTTSGLSTEVVGGVRGPRGPADARGPAPSLVALCTSSGVIKVGTAEREMWQLSVSRPLFALGRVDVTGDHVDEFVACAWDGYTCVVDHDKNVVEYEFGRELCAFASGRYAVTRGRNEPVFVYATLQDPETNQCTISIRHSLDIRSVGARLLPPRPPPFVQDSADDLAAHGIDVEGASTVDVYTRVLAAEAALTARHAELRNSILEAHARRERGGGRADMPGDAAGSGHGGDAARPGGPPEVQPESVWP